MISDEIVDFAGNYVKGVAKQSLKRYSRDPDITIAELKEPIKVDSFFGEYMSIIMLWSGIGSITIKAHFNLEFALRLASKVLQKEEVSRDVALDCMRELNNLIGGCIRGDWEKQHILVGMSLPFLASGKDEIVFRTILDPRARVSYWLLTNGKEDIVCSSEICLLDTSRIKKIRKALEEALNSRDQELLENSGEVSFF